MPHDLSRYSVGNFERGRPAWMELLWRIVMGVVFQSPFVPSYAVKRWLLRRFGARVGDGVCIKPRVTITLPWKVELGEHVWIGEGAWLDSLAPIRIGPHAVVSQGVYLCTGNHDFRRPDFALRVEPIELGRASWVTAGSVVGPGVRIGEGAILGLGSVTTADLEPLGIYRGNPAVRVGTRSANTER